MGKMAKDRVAYFYDDAVSEVYYGANHPMKPPRIAMAHHLVVGYDLHEHMQVFRPRRATPAELAQFHTEDYVSFLQNVTPENENSSGMVHEVPRYLSEDCPVFHGLYDFCQLYAGASIEGAMRLNHGLSDIAINWAGGLHHAKKAEAQGFCYINDLVLAILELLKYHARVVYIDIDIHHGDGVEEAFYLTDRCMTVSFHKYGDLFFPGTGDIKDTGEQFGKHYSVNVPLRDGIDDVTFLNIFRPVMSKVMEMYQPGAIVLQCGADSLANDRLGCFSLSLEGHSEAVRFMKSFNLPMLVTGGGGYTKHNVARCWAYETSVLLDVELSNQLPDNAYMEYFGPSFKLKTPPVRQIENLNSKQYVEAVKKEVLENLSFLDHAPGVQMQEVPPDAFLPEFSEIDLGEEPGEGGLLQYGDRLAENRDEWS